MFLTSNKGEWSELYAFLKILSDKKLYSADESLTLIPNSFLKVLSVIRKEGNDDLSFDIDEVNDTILVKKNHELLGVLPIYKITSKLSDILEKIKKGKGITKGSFSLPEAEVVMNELYCSKITASSNKKSDISLKIEDPNTGTQPIQGFSIKSKIGGLSTLLNASGATNFEFKITKDSKNKFNFNPRIGLERILLEDETLEFSSIPNVAFRRNLSMIDSHMPKIMGEMIKSYYFGLESSVKNLTNLVEIVDPLNVGDHQHFYEYKIQELLLSVAFGMQPSKQWTGSYETHGGYIIVKKNGELACYHIYDRDKFKKFLLANTKFETPSPSKHKFGNVYEKDGEKYILLNLQIRFNN